MATIEVIVLTYNRAELFEQTLRSVCEQTYKDFTVKVFDNGSTDNTKDVYLKVKANYPDRKFDYFKLEENHQDEYFIQKKNEFITADYVIVFHDDDLMHPMYVESLMKVIDAHPDVVLLGGKTRMLHYPEKFDWVVPTGKYTIGDTRDMIKRYYRGDTFSFSAICYRSEYYKEARFNHELYGNRGDVPFLIDISKHGLVCELQDRFLHYRIHEGNDYHKLPTMQQRINLINKFAEILLSGDESCKEVFYNRIYQDCTLYDFIDYQTAKEQGWLTAKTDKKLRRECSFPYLYFKCILYKTIASIVFKTSDKIKLRKKYAKEHLKYKKKLKKLKELHKQ